jgi:hypothetical protein
MPSPKYILRCSLPALLLALACLCPFFNKAYTIDDSYFMLEAQQTVRTPLTPAATSICWNAHGYKEPLRKIGSPAILMGYLLVPAVLSGGDEWVAHLTIFLFLAVLIVATVALAFRLGCGQWESSLAGLLVATFPVVLGMAGTAMPDVPAAALATLGLERLCAWRTEKRLSQAIAAGFLLGLAPLGRIHTIVLLLPAVVILAAGDKWLLSPRQIRQLGLRHWLPVLLTIVCFASFTWMTSDTSAASTGVRGVGPNLDQLAWDNVARNVPQIGVNWMLTVPFGFVWLLVKRPYGPWILGAALLGSLVHFFVYKDKWWILYSIGVAGLIAIGWVIAAAIRDRQAFSLALGLCLLISLPIFMYLHLPPKYMVPSAPAAAILLARELSLLAGRRRLFASAAIVCAGAALGVAILRADAAFSGAARQIVHEYVEPEIRAGRTVWYAGQWSLSWYGEKAGALCAVESLPGPQRGDLIVGGDMEGGLAMVERVPRLRRRLLRTISIGAPGGRIMSPAINTGFYSNQVGYLPWRWSTLPIDTYYVWDVE